MLEFVVGKRRFLTTKILRKGSLEHPNLAKSKEREGEDEGEGEGAWTDSSSPPWLMQLGEDLQILFSSRILSLPKTLSHGVAKGGLYRGREGFNPPCELT